MITDAVGWVGVGGMLFQSPSPSFPCVNMTEKSQDYIYFPLTWIYLCNILFCHIKKIKIKYIHHEQLNKLIILKNRFYWQTKALTNYKTSFNKQKMWRGFVIFSTPKIIGFRWLGSQHKPDSDLSKYFFFNNFDCYKKAALKIFFSFRGL